MSITTKQAEFNKCVMALRETIISEKDATIEVENRWGSGMDVFSPGIVIFNYAGDYRENFSMVGGYKSIHLHGRVMKSDSEPILLGSAKSSEFRTLFMNGYRVGNGRDSADIISTDKIHAAALVVADILAGIEKEANQELGWKSRKAGVDFYLAKHLGIDDAVELMRKLKELPTSSAAGLYSADNTEPSRAWYTKKELAESFWQFGKDRRTELFERRTGICIPVSNKEMPLLAAEIDRLLKPTENVIKLTNSKPTLLGDIADFKQIRKKINL